ncbi:membrane-spanning 4-domains subfamily A member 8 isoform X1 [Etheostoma spectabile]|uniref:membrane-spanning 4-domains subfamily A member 8 isoform X1 n=1 Tax=Etheostoma spectabile TaxID=54343 RepID=UPI0013AFC85F|nr:membrane-spanning 4-domains subfamily A member 8-like isoform X1 [Etheostoma spectabile]XP_032374452.1 membrane-spanning 4-domains subfamily A member 8-like isoform X2 [Etheostoma spectabile]XP_032374453.1 membrane-spanning 4-domains subfamily A member 8-like isoform X1 [Etheostoma spectabile]
MSVTMTKGDGIPVFTVTSDPESVYPPLCQILKNLCYSPVCCSVSEHLRRVQRSSQSVLGALHIMVGLLNIGLGTILFCFDRMYFWSQINSIGFPFWLGGLFILFGTIDILSEKYPSPCLVIINVILSHAGVAFAITGIVLYSIYMTTIHMLWMCRNYDDDYYSSYRRQTTTPSPEQDIMKEKCLEVKELILMLLRSISAVLIVLSTLELCLSISSAVMAIKALERSQKGEKEKTGDPELYKPLLEEVTSNPTV